MNMFARFDENPAMTLQDIKETKRYGRTKGCTHAHMDMKTVYPPQTKFAGGIIKEGVTNIPLKEETGLCLHLSRNSISQSMEASTCSHIPGREELFYYERKIEYTGAWL